MCIEKELKEKLNEPILKGLFKETDKYSNCPLIFKNTEELYSCLIKDKNLGYLFFKDDENKIVEERFAEHERVDNYLYSTNLLYYHSYQKLKEIDTLLIPLYKGITEKHIIDYRIRVLPGDYFINLCSVLDLVSLVISLIHGFPINAYNCNLKKIILFLELITNAKSSLFNVNTLSSQEKKRLNDLSDDAKDQSQNLARIIFGNVKDFGDINWIEELYNYRNYMAHKNFLAVVFCTNGPVYLPKNPNILPSIVIDKNEKELFKLLNDVPLHVYCEDRFKKCRKLIEEIFESLVETYEWRLENPEAIVNPHESFRKLNKWD